MPGIPGRADRKQQEHIRRAVDEAIKRRNRYAEDRVADLLGTLKSAADDVAQQIRRFEEKVALKPWDEMRLAILKDLEEGCLTLTRSRGLRFTPFADV